jgi:hypothetical protein
MRRESNPRQTSIGRAREIRRTGEAAIVGRARLSPSELDSPAFTPMAS